MLDHGKGVHVGAEQQHRPGTILHDRNHTRLADLLGNLEAELAHLCGELGGRAHLLHRQLGIRVEVAVERHQLRHVGADRVLQCGSIGGGRQGHGGNHQSEGQLHQRAPWVDGSNSITSI